MFPSAENDIHLESWKTDIASPSGAAGRHVLWSPKLSVPLLQWNMLHVMASSILLCVTGQRNSINANTLVLAVTVTHVLDF